MKNIFHLLTAIFLLSACSPKGQMTITVENPSDFDREAELIEIPLDSIKDKIKLTDTLVYVVTDEEGKIIPSQITYNRYLVFQSGLKAKQKATFIIKKDTVQIFEPKTYGRFITERKDDFAWENDRVAFRIYGAALIPSDGPSNGIDVWYKRTNSLIIDKWYENDLSGKASYHTDNGEGLDDYKVGRSLGAGAMAPFVNDKLWLNENFIGQEVLENGPLRTTFKLTYKDIVVDGKSYSESRTISIDAGSQLTKIIQAYGISEPMKVAAGFVKREKNDSILSSDKYIIYAQPVNPTVGDVFLGLVFPKGIDKAIIDSYTVENSKTKKTDTYSHVLGVTEQLPNIPVTYYTGYGWSKFGFTSIDDFQTYIKNFSTALDQPFIITY